MKKRIIFYVALFIATLSCSDDFTDLPAVGALSDQALQNEIGVDLLLTGTYSVLDGLRNNQNAPEWAVTGDNWWLDVISDDAHKGSTDGDQADLFEIERFSWETANIYFFGKWAGLYAGVNRANAVIDLISKITEGDFTSKEAEARFLKAHFNFELQKIFGAPAYISVENFQNTEFNQPNPGPIWDQIEADFQFAVANLPPAIDAAEPGRANAWAAKAYLGKVHLYQGEWAQALTLLNDVINNGPYALNANFVDNFNAAGENGPESIFAIQFAADGGLSFNGNRGATLNFPNGGPINSCCGFYQPTQDLVNAFKTDAATGLPLLDTYNQSDFKNDYGITSQEPFTPDTTTPVDSRLDYTVGRRGIDYNGWGENVGKDWIRADFADISGPYQSTKNFYQAGEDGNRGTGDWGQQRSGINYNIIRFADVLLMGAEAAVETGDLALALDYVNRVRNRAKTMSKRQAVAGSGDAANYVVEPYASFADPAFARKAVRFERRVEFGMEGHRLFDLRRWGVAEQVINTYIGNEARTIPSIATKFLQYDSRHDRIPIPLNAIDLSGAVLQQNPGF